MSKRTVVAFESLMFCEFFDVMKHLGMDERTNEFHPIYWNALDGKMPTTRAVTSVHAHWRKLGFTAVDVTNEDWIKLV